MATVDLESHGKTLQTFLEDHKDMETQKMVELIIGELAMRRLTGKKTFILTDQLEEALARVIIKDIARLKKRRFNVRKLEKKAGKIVAKQTLKRMGIKNDS